MSQIISKVQERFAELIKAEVFYSLNFSNDNVFDSVVILQSLKNTYNTTWFDKAYSLLEEEYDNLDEDHPEEEQLYLVMDRMMWLYIIAEDLEEDEALEELEKFNLEGIHTGWNIDNIEKYISNTDE